jgi:hypothetical protein
MTININKLGGINDETPAAIKRAHSVDLITLPREVTGTNCYNCRFIKNKTPNYGYCAHPKVKQHVNERMCCALWDRVGSLRIWKEKK